MKKEFRKNINDEMKKARMDAKLDYCVYCGKKCSSFCNSHLIPRFILKVISKNGCLNNFFYYTELGTSKIVDSENGLNQALTFKMICRKCDSTIFRDYEDFDKIKQEPTNKVLAEIALKNTLRYWYKRNYENASYNNMKKIVTSFEKKYEIEEREKINGLDLKEIKKDFKRYKIIIDKDLKSGTKLIFRQELDYVIPIAFQGSLCLYCDLNGNVINNLYDYSEKNMMQYIHLCVFPLDNSSIILLFRHKDDTRYNSFINQFNKLDLENKLKLISFIIINYSEDYLFSPNISDILKNSTKIRETAQKRTDIIADSKIFLDKMIKINKNALKLYIDFPNILGEEYKL